MAAAIGDPILLRLPRAVWQALPVLVLAGVGAAVVVSLTLWIAAGAPPVAALAAAVFSAPIVGWGVDGVHRALFHDPTRVPVRRRMIAAEAAIVPPATLAVGSLIVAEAAATAGSWHLQVIAVTMVLLTVVVAMVGVVVLPLASMRGDVALRSVVMVSLVAVLRRPLSAFATLAAAASIVWLGATWFAGLLVLAVAVLCPLMVAASWATTAPIGVDVPRCTPLRSTRHALPGDEA